MIDRLQLHKNIMSIVAENEFDYIDAILHYCSVNDLEIETVGAIISKDTNLVSLLEEQAENLHFIKRISKLPI